MQYTDNYELKKPELTDFALITDMSDNMDTIDAALKDLDDDKLDSNEGDISDTRAQTITASPASYPLPAAGNKLSTILGKINKFLSDLKANAVATITASGKTLTLKNAAGNTLGTVTTQDTWNANSGSVDGYVTAPGSNREYNVWMVGSNGEPAWRAHVGAYDHGGLFGAAQYRLLYNAKESDGSRDLDNASSFFSIGADGVPRWRKDILASTARNGLMSIADYNLLHGGLLHYTGTSAPTIQNGATFDAIAGDFTIGETDADTAYLAIATVSVWDNISSGYLSAKFGDGAASESTNTLAQSVFKGQGNTVTTMRVFTRTAAQGPTRVYLFGRQTSGSAVTARCNVIILRLK